MGKENVPIIQYPMSIVCSGTLGASEAIHKSHLHKNE